MLRIRLLKLANTQTEGQKQITYPQDAIGTITKLLCQRVEQYKYKTM